MIRFLGEKATKIKICQNTQPYKKARRFKGELVRFFKIILRAFCQGSVRQIQEIYYLGYVGNIYFPGTINIGLF